LPLNLHLLLALKLALALALKLALALALKPAPRPDSGLSVLRWWVSGSGHKCKFKGHPGSGSSRCSVPETSVWGLFTKTVRTIDVALQHRSSGSFDLCRKASKEHA